MQSSVALGFRNLSIRDIKHIKQEDVDEDLTMNRKKKNRRYHRKHKKNSSCRERRKARNAAITKSKMENIKNFSDIELTENQKRALCLGQGFIVLKSFKVADY